MLPAGALAAVTMALLLVPAGAAAASCLNASARPGPSERLPDCRAYEQVSPVQKGGSDAISLASGFLRPVEAAPADGAIAYDSITGAFAAPSSSLLFNGYASSLSESGWSTSDVTPPTAQSTSTIPAGVGYDFSPDLSHVVIRVEGQELTPGAPQGVYNLFLRRPDGSYALITTVPPAVSQAECASCFQSTDLAGFAGASSDYSKVVFEANESLTTGAPASGTENLYENVEGNLALVGVLPDGVIAPGGATAGAGSSDNGSLCPFCSQDIAGAVSADGSRVIFQAVADGGAPDPAQEGQTEVYQRVDGSSTVEISKPAPGATPANPAPAEAKFWAASTDGTEVFFTSKAELTSNANTGAANEGNDLYAADPGTGAVTDLSADSTDANGAQVQGVVGASTDGSYVYFVADGILSPGHGVAGEPNLYVSHEGAPSFIATLAGPGLTKEGEETPGDTNDWTSTPAHLRAYVTPDGQHLAFMSVNSLTGFDNSDLATGEPDSEVYEYSAPAATLVCASCVGSGHPVAGAFIGATLAGELMSSPFHQPRALSDDGTRLFFSSSAPLAAEAGGPYVKVYEYSGGSVGLLSTGPRSADDFFLDASTGGDDVFIASRQRLAPSDQDDLADVYDARVDGKAGGAASVPQCSGEGCQGAPAPTPVFALPATTAQLGNGNLVAPAARPVPHPKPRPRPCPRGRIRRKVRGKSTCVKRKPTRRAVKSLKPVHR
ncbi:MAG: TolB-like translocation protein [Solirubrobacteraceae bacterium]